jgi:hypothetical protein
MAGNSGKREKIVDFLPLSRFFTGSKLISFRGRKTDSATDIQPPLKTAAASAAVPPQGRKPILHGGSPGIAGYEISLLGTYYCYAFRYETAPEEAAT